MVLVLKGLLMSTHREPLAATPPGAECHATFNALRAKCCDPFGVRRALKA